MKWEVELREGLQKTIDYFKARPCHLEFQHRCPYVECVLQCPRVRETACLKLELPALHFWSIWKSWDEHHSECLMSKALYVFYYHFISFYFTILFIVVLACFSLGIAASWSVRLQQRDVPLIKNAQALDLRKFSKPTGHNAHHSTEQEDGGRAQLYVDKWTRDSNLTTHVVIDWVSGTCVRNFDRNFVFAPNFWDFYTSKLCDWEGVTRGHGAGPLASILIWDLPGESQETLVLRRGANAWQVIRFSVPVRRVFNGENKRGRSDSHGLMQPFTAKPRLSESVQVRERR